MSVQCLMASEYQINATYGVDIWGGSLSETFDSSSSTFQIESCNQIILSLFPQAALNDTKYSLYTENGDFVSYSNNDYQFSNIPTGNYTIRDGNVVVFHYQKTYTNPNTLYEVILTDNLYNEITGFSPEELNSTQLSAGVRDLNTLQIDSCAPYVNFFLNGNYIADIETVTFVEGDSLCVGIDGIESCTMGCYSYSDSCYVVSESLAITEFDSKVDYQLYPNPTKESIFIKNDVHQIKEILLYDINMKMIKTKSVKNSSPIEIDLSILDSGIYFLKIVSDKSMTIKKIIKE
ncbi:T9SS type A sorting domain-containing protein [Lacinutrix cladophorae]